MNTKKKALGRGLSAILESPETDITSKDISGNYVVGAIASISIDKIEPNPFQPRIEFEPEHLSDLAESIKEQGIIQPITIRKMGFDKYQLISGERRLKASKIAGLTEIPAFIRVANDQQMLELALVENIQRQNLNAIEIAISYQRLIDECNLSQDDLSQRVSQNRSTVANYLRLLKLPPELQIALRDNKISMSHARSIINIEDSDKQLSVFKKIIENDLSVRQVEDLVRNINKTEQPKIKAVKGNLPFEIDNLCKELSLKFSSPVKIVLNKNGKGSLNIKFNSKKDLEILLNSLGKMK